ncbi:MAG TPA: TetR/AcrR family transcriptional regulator [Noviherbaspirillum sp.]|nr:TetR/AcrR family transcriptional regulator [Noviherbaspirillum sp.]
MVEDAQSTRTRILETCLRLFNEASPAAVTTAEIARVAGINEGNLYYYFKKKTDILIALFEQFESALNQTANAPQASRSGLEYLKTWFTLMWEWRFFYRDGSAIIRMAPELRARCVNLTARGQADIRRVLQGMKENGRLTASDTELDRLVVNAWIISSYWLDYLHSRHNVDQFTAEHLDWGLSQVLSLFLPYLPAESAGNKVKPARKG